jgi:hypothetical protein
MSDFEACRGLFQ